MSHLVCVIYEKLCHALMGLCGVECKYSGVQKRTLLINITVLYNIVSFWILGVHDWYRVLAKEVSDLCN